MKFQMIVNIDPDSNRQSLIDYVESEGISWEVTPGMCVQERVFTNLHTLYRFMNECEKIYGDSLSFCMDVLPKDNPQEEDTIYVKIQRSKI